MTKIIIGQVCVNTCELCGARDKVNTINLNGYKILASCEDCKEEILNVESTKEVSREELIQNALRVGLPKRVTDKLKNEEILKLTLETAKLIKEMDSDEREYLE